MASKKTKSYISPKKYSKVLDGVAIGHILVTHLIMLVGTFTPYLNWLSLHFENAQMVGRSFARTYPELMFIYRYLDFPIYWIFGLFGPWVIDSPKDLIRTYIYAEMVILGSTVFYCYIVYLFIRAMKK